MSIDLWSLTLTQLRYIVAVDRHRSFRVAAEHCRVSQPALSMQIQKLEEILGAAIFDRSHQPVLTTDRGAAIAAQARVILRECERLGDLAQVGEAPSGTYRLGVIPTLAPSLVPLLLPRFVAAYPRVSLVVEERPTDALIQGLLDDSLDGGLAATPLDVPLVRERPLFLEPFYVYLSRITRSASGRGSGRAISLTSGHGSSPRGTASARRCCTSARSTGGASRRGPRRASRAGASRRSSGSSTRAWA